MGETDTTEPTVMLPQIKPPPRLAWEGKLELTEVLRSHDRS